VIPIPASQKSVYRKIKFSSRAIYAIMTIFHVIANMRAWILKHIILTNILKELE
jgi:hypothetical protein